MAVTHARTHARPPSSFISTQHREAFSEVSEYGVRRLLEAAVVVT